MELYLSISVGTAVAWCRHRAGQISERATMSSALSLNTTRCCSVEVSLISGREAQTHAKKKSADLTQALFSHSDLISTQASKY